MYRLALRDNRGLTLIELLLGVVILSIIVVPLLHTFIVGAGTEKKSRDYGNATGAAQNLAEQIQAYDTDRLLNDAGVVASDAKFYVLNGDSYVSPNSRATPLPDGTDKTYYLGIQNYSYGGSTFDALVTLKLNAANATNSTDVSVSNQMDAYLDMSDADTNAESALKDECGGLVDDPSSLTKAMLTRSITFNITKISGTLTDTYTVDVLFNYSCTVTYAEDGETLSIPFSNTQRSTASVGSIVKTNDGSPFFSAYMFFDGYYRSEINNKIVIEQVIINNPTGSDINFFLVNTHSIDPVPSNYSWLLWYKYQNFSGNTPVNDLVFTNLPKEKIEYRASKDYFLRKTLPVTGYLVEAKKQDRMFDVNIKLFKSGSSFTGASVLDIDSTKLN